MVFNRTDRVQRIGKLWGNIAPGMAGTVVDADVDGNGKKVRVLFDLYRSEREDGTVIVMAKTLRRLDAYVVAMQANNAALRNVMTDNKVMVDNRAPIRADPFEGKKEVQRVFVTRSEPHKLSKPKRGPTVEHVDLTVPFHKQLAPRLPDSLLMSNYRGSEELEGLVGEGFEPEEQDETVEAIEHRMERAARAPKARLSNRAQIRPGQPFTAYEKLFHTRKLDPRDVLTSMEPGRTRYFYARGEALQAAMNHTFAMSKFPNK